MAFPFFLMVYVSFVVIVVSSLLIALCNWYHPISDLVILISSKIIVIWLMYSVFATNSTFLDAISNFLCVVFGLPLNQHIPLCTHLFLVCEMIYCMFRRTFSSAQISFQQTRSNILACCCSIHFEIIYHAMHVQHICIVWYILWPSVCLTSLYWNSWMDQQVFGTEATLGLFCSLFIREFGYLEKNWGTSLWKLVPNSELRLFLIIQHFTSTITNLCNLFWASAIVCNTLVVTCSITQFICNSWDLLLLTVV